MKNPLLTDSSITSLWESVGKLNGKKALEKWRLCQTVFELLKRGEKDKKEALEKRARVLMADKNYSIAYYELREAKGKIEKAEEEAMRDEIIRKHYDEADALRICRNEEIKILQNMFNQTALACKKDPLQVPFSLFVENENPDTIDRFGYHFKYELGVEGVGRFHRGKHGESPSDFAEQLAKLGKDINNYINPEIKKLATQAGLEGYE